MTPVVLMLTALIVGRVGGTLAEVVMARRRARRLLAPPQSPPARTPVDGLRRVAILLASGSLAGGGRERTSVERDLPAALDAIARSLRSGSTVAAAVEEAATAVRGPLAADLARVAERAARHGSVAALEAWAQSTPEPGVRLAVAALVLGAESGGAPGRAVDGVAAGLRARLAVAAEVRALSSQARLSAVVIALAPVAFAVLASATDSGVAGVLFGTKLGSVLLAGGLLLDAAGAVWMAHLCRLRRHAGIDDELPEVVALFAVAVGSGLTVRLAVEAVAARAPGALAAELRRVLADCARGQLLADALVALPARGGDVIRPLAAALADADRYGAPLGPALERLAADGRDHWRRRAEERARRLPVLLLFPLVLCVLPAFGLLTVAPLLAGAVDALAA